MKPCEPIDPTTSQDEQKKVEQEVRFQTRLLDSVEQAVIATNLEGQVIYWNHFAEVLYGWSAMEAMGRSITDLTPADAAEGQTLEIMSRLQRGESWSGEFPVKRRDGSTFLAMVTDSPIYSEEGQLEGIIGISYDITAQRQAQEALQEADRRKTEFLSILGHELRNPLAVITNTLHILEEMGPGSSRAPEYQAIISRQTQQLTHLVDDLLSVSRIEAGHLKLQKETLDLNVAVRHAIEAVPSLTHGLKHHVSIFLPSQPVYVEVDPRRLEQIIINLVNNAVKYTPPGGQIAVSVETSEDSGIVRVRDNGIGLTSELQHRMFEMFTRGESAEAQAGGGLGIGLALVKRLVEMHGGSVMGTSQGTGRGSEFVVRLPLLLEPHPASMTRERGANAGERRLEGQGRVLVVDDSPDAAVTLSEILQLWGYDVRSLCDSTKAMETVTEFRPDTVLLDIGMPGVDGYELARRLRAEPSTSDTFLVAITGYGQEEDLLKSKEAGFDYHLVKPVNLEEIHHMLSAIPLQPK